MRRALAAVAGAAVAAAGIQFVTVATASANTAGTGLVISEVYGAGGNTGAALNQDFVELFNPTGASIPVAGLSVQYRSATGTANPSGVVPLTGSVAAYSHYLVGLAAGSTGAAIPTPDVTSTSVNLSGTTGTVFLVNGTTALTSPPTGSLVGNSSIIDLVGFGSSNTYEGAVAPAPSPTSSIGRATCGADTDNNSLDLTAGTPTPANTSSAAESSCGSGSTTPPVALVAPGQQHVAAGSAFSLQLNATGGTTPYTFSLDGDASTLGLTVDENGVVTGAPTTPGVYSVSAHVTDSASTPTTASQTFTFTVTAPSGTGAPATPHPLISEVYTDGGFTGSTFLNDFVELYNPSSSSVDLSNYSIGYSADLRGTGTYTLPLTSARLSGSIPAHGYYLIQGHEDTKAVGAALPTADFVWPSAPDFYYKAGLIVLSDQPTPPIPSTGDIANTAHIVDALGYGGDANTFETARQGTDLGGTTSANRTVPGTDTDNNAADFSVNSPTPTNALGESGGSVTTGGTCTSPTPSIAEVQGTDTDTSPYAGCSVTVQGIVTAAYPTGGLSGFTVQTAGTGGGSDSTPGASDAVFVYGSTSAAAVSVGESVSVTGTVQEFAGETEISSPTVTQLTPALAPVTPAQLSWSDLDTDAKREAHESELIAPQGHYTVTDNYNLNYYGTIVLAADSTTPLSDPTDVAAPGSADAQATAAYDATHTITLDDGSSWNYSASSHTGDPLPWLTATHSVTIGAQTTFGSAGVILDYRNSVWNYQPTHQVTDTGTDVATFTDMRGTVNAAPQDVGGNIKLATFNMENYFYETGDQFVADGLGSCSFYKDRSGAEITDNTCTFDAAHAASVGSAGPRGAATDVSRQRQMDKEVYGVNHLGASIVSLEEVENSAKYGEDRDFALSKFVDALNAAAGAGTWDYIRTNDLTQPGVIDEDVIRSAFIYKPADVTPVGAAQILSNDSAAGQPFSIAREPLAQAFKGAGEPDSTAFLVVSNHFKSKGADANGLFNDCGTGKGDAENTDPAADQGGFNCTRVHEAADMSTWAEGLAQADGIAPIFMLGDFNAYTHEDPLEALYAKGYHDLQTTENGPGAKATYSYGGLEGSLDHVLGNDAALAMVTGADVWQIDGQEPVAYVYSRYNYNVTQLFSADNPFGISDHDPEIVGLRLPRIATVPATQAAPTATAGVGTATVSWSAPDDGGSPITGYRVTPYVGTTAGTPVAVDGSTLSTTFTGLTNGTSYTFTVTAINAVGASVESPHSAAVTPQRATATVVADDATFTKTSGSVRVSVTAPGRVPTGTVTIKDGTTTVGTATLVNGVANVTLTKAYKRGTYQLVAAYSGDASVLPGADGLTLTVVNHSGK